MLSQNTYRCRLCLKVSAEVINIFRQDFPKMIKLLTTIQVNQTDELPKVACISCARKVKSAMVLRKQIIRSHKTLIEEALVKKNEATKFNFANSDTSMQQIQTVILLENDIKTEKDEDIIIIGSPKPAAIISSDTQVINEGNKKNKPQDLPTSLNRNEISIIRVNKLNSKASCTTKTPTRMNRAMVQASGRRLLKPNLLISNNAGRLLNQSVPEITRRNSQISIKPGILDKRRGPKPKTSKYNPLTPIPCKICQKVIQKTNMKKHLETHDKKTVTCHLCGKVTNHTSLRTHIFYFHKCKEDQYVCDQCGRHFRYRTKFNLHMKKQHGGTKDFECNICGRKFFERKYLTKHVDSHHNKIRPYICDSCGKDFSSNHALKVHFRQHTESAPYSCDRCGQKFKQNVSLRTHRKQVHNICEEENVICEECGKGFASKVALTSHFRLHERKKCSHCSEVFVSDDYLSRHVKEKHETVLHSGGTEISEAVTAQDSNTKEEYSDNA